MISDTRQWHLLQLRPYLLLLRVGRYNDVHAELGRESVASVKKRPRTVQEVDGLHSTGPTSWPFVAFRVRIVFRIIFDLLNYI